MRCKSLVLFGGQQDVSGSQTAINTTETDIVPPGEATRTVVFCVESWTPSVPLRQLVTVDLIDAICSMESNVDQDSCQRCQRPLKIEQL